jgi:hypothetical protein
LTVDSYHAPFRLQSYGKKWGWQQYYCPNGAMSLETFRQKLYNKVDEMILRKYGRDYIK